MKRTYNMKPGRARRRRMAIAVLKLSSKAVPTGTDPEHFFGTGKGVKL